MLLSHLLMLLLFLSLLSGTLLYHCFSFLKL
jgi:hypothetical protein